MIKTEPNTIEALRECCIYKSPALILNAEAGTVCHARFASLSSESVVLDVPWEETIDLMPRRCCISFAYRGDSRAFFATVREYRKNIPPQPSSLILDIPKQVVGIEARSAYRVPVGKTGGFHVRTTTREGASLAARPIDLSMTGILIEYPADKDPNLTIGDEIEVELQLHTEAVKLKGEVRRRDGHRYGLFFPEVVNKRGITPPDPLKSMVEILERNWLQDRVR